jgi:hypothetical protein
MTRFIAGVLTMIAVLAIGCGPIRAQGPGVLYAFANPLTNQLADHTWVTDYHQPRCQNPKSRYWYATGKCHPTGDDRHRLLRQAPADLKVAECIAKPDLSTFTAGPATAQIRYGIDGVCHQICNRVLWSTAVGGATPITVAGAEGYGASRFAYGTYGTPLQWSRLKKDCGVESSSRSLIDDIRSMISQRLGTTVTSDKAEMLVTEHVRLRAELNALEGRSGSALAAAANGAINASLRRAGESLTADEFQAFFDWPKGREIILVHAEPR